MDFKQIRIRCSELTAKPCLSGRQVLRIMKLTTLMMLITCLAASASGFSQITLEEHNTPLSKVLRKMERQSGYRFLCPLELMKKSGNVTVTIKDQNISEALTNVLQGKPLSFSISEKTVVIKERLCPESLLSL